MKLDYFQKIILLIAFILLTFINSKQNKVLEILMFI